MTWDQIKLMQDKTFLLPGWEGTFKWDYNKQEMIFKNGNYHLNERQLLDMNLQSRTDWYYII